VAGHAQAAITGADTKKRNRRRLLFSNFYLR